MHAMLLRALAGKNPTTGRTFDPQGYTVEAIARDKRLRVEAVLRSQGAEPRETLPQQFVRNTVMRHGSTEVTQTRTIVLH